MINIGVESFRHIISGNFRKFTPILGRWVVLPMLFSAILIITECTPTIPTVYAGCPKKQKVSKISVFAYDSPLLVVTRNIGKKVVEENVVKFETLGLLYSG